MAGGHEFAVDVARGDHGATVVTVKGELDLATAPELEAALETTPAGSRVVIDLTDCLFLDSSGLRALLAEAARMESGGGSCALVAPAGAIRRVLEIAGLEERLAIHETRDGAL